MLGLIGYVDPWEVRALRTHYTGVPAWEASFLASVDLFLKGSQPPSEFIAFLFSKPFVKLGIQPTAEIIQGSPCHHQIYHKLEKRCFFSHSLSPSQILCITIPILWNKKLSSEV